MLVNLLSCVITKSPKRSGTVIGDIDGVGSSRKASAGKVALILSITYVNKSAPTCTRINLRMVERKESSGSIVAHQGSLWVNTHASFKSAPQGVTRYTAGTI